MLYFEQHGIMPKNGGMNDQPTQWFYALQDAQLIRNLVRKQHNSRDDEGNPNWADVLTEWELEFLQVYNAWYKQTWQMNES